MRKQELQNVPITSLVPYGKPVHNTDKASEDIATSLEEYGYVKTSIVVDESMVLICGQGVLQAMQKLGWTAVPEVTQVIGMPEIKKRKYRLADNQSSAKSKWNIETLLQEIDEIKAEDTEFDIGDLGFTQRDVDQMLHDIEEKYAEEDDFDPDTIRETDIQRGDIFQLGPHRLMCADATNIEDIRKLLGILVPRMIFTDPPYNVNYTGKTKAALKIKNDCMNQSDFYQFLLRAYRCMHAVAAEGSPIYVCHADSETLAFRQAFLEAGLELKQCIIWVKDQFVLGRQDYHWQHEPILYGWKPGEVHRWFGGRDKSTVWEVPKPARNAEHPTMKPLELVARAVQNSSTSGDVVLDPFGGLGSTLMACEQTGRVCCTGELDPHYCQGIIDRWEKFTGKTARKVSA